jgi:hypothetical protein
LLFLCGSIGVVLYLNLKAGTSFAWPLVRDPAMHEARDRDYFFVLGFWAWGIWAGLGAMVLARRLAAGRATNVIGVSVAAIPIALNWSAVTRRSEPDADLPRIVARTLLEPLPEGAVLLVAGDNDTYPLWYAQQVEGLRPDVAVVTIPMLGAQWYADEMRRRWGFNDAVPLAFPGIRADRIVADAERDGRAVAISLAVPVEDRNQLNKSWTVIGVVAIAAATSAPSADHSTNDSTVMSIDRAATAAEARRVARWLHGRSVRPSVDPASERFYSLLECPKKLAALPPDHPPSDSLASACNLR